MTRRIPVLRVAEDNLTTSVIDLCRVLHIDMRYHPHDSRDSEFGWPDWVLLGPLRDGRRHCLIRELKSDTGRVSAAQRAWVDGLREAGIDADVWTPDDLRSGRIERELKALARARRVEG